MNRLQIWKRMGRDLRPARQVAWEGMVSAVESGLGLRLVRRLVTIVIEGKEDMERDTDCQLISPAYAYLSCLSCLKESNTNNRSSSPPPPHNPITIPPYPGGCMPLQTRQQDSGVQPPGTIAHSLSPRGE